MIFKMTLIKASECLDTPFSCKYTSYHLSIDTSIRKHQQRLPKIFKMEATDTFM